MPSSSDLHYIYTSACCHKFGRDHLRAYRPIRHAQLAKNDGWTALFLVTTILASLTGFLFPHAGFTPAQGVGLTSTVVLTATLLALYVFHLAGAWRWIYVVGAVLALYLNVASAPLRALVMKVISSPRQ